MTTNNAVISPEKQYLIDLIVSQIAEASDNPIEDITPTAHLSRELNLTRQDYARLLKLIEKTYNEQIIDDQIAPISLDPLLEESEIEEVETTQDLIDAVSNEIELG